MTTKPKAIPELLRLHLQMLGDTRLFPDLDQVQGRPDDATLDQMDQAAGYMSRIIASTSRVYWRRELSAACARARQARFEYEDVRDRLTGALQRFARTQFPNRWLLALSLAVSLVAIGGDIGLTWLVLPTLLNIPPRSPLGFSLGCTPLIATAVLKHLFDRMFEAIEFYCAKPEGSWARRTAGIVDLLFHAALLSLNVVMLVKLGLGREEAAKILQSLVDLVSDAPVPPIDRGLVGSLVIWVGLVGVLDSALVVGKLIKQLHEMAQRRSAKREVTNLRKEAGERHRELGEAEAKEGCLREEWQEHPDREREIGDAMHSRARAKLAEIRGRSRGRRPTLREIVASALVPGDESTMPADWPEQGSNASGK